VVAAVQRQRFQRPLLLLLRGRRRGRHGVRGGGGNERQVLLFCVRLLVCLSLNKYSWFVLWLLLFL
jgi:hypothetical protein